MTVQISFSRQRMMYLTLFFGIIFLFCSVSFLAANAAFLVNDHIYQGVVIDDISVGGLSQEAAQSKIAARLQEHLMQSPLKLTTETQSYIIRPQDIHLAFDSTELARKAYEVGRTGNLFKQLKDRYVVLNYGQAIPLNLSYDVTELKNCIQTIAQSIDEKAKNATLVISDDKISIAPEANGYKTDVDKTLTAFENELKKHSSFQLPLIVETIFPVVVAADLAGINSMLASYTTQFSKNDLNRIENILIAASHVQGILIKPNEIFSFNDSVGKRLAEFGYKEAPGFINGKLVPDIGGGVCQVSSTLYNAVLLADMTILERTSHFSPPGYVPLGQDATVADNLLDFRFQNTSAKPIYIVSEIAGTQLTVYVYGTHDEYAPDIQIVATDKKILEPAVVIKQDSSIDLGREIVEDSGRKGYQVTTYRVKSKNRQEISREELATDVFPPSDEIIRVGTKVSGNQRIK